MGGGVRIIWLSSPDMHSSSHRRHFVEDPCCNAHYCSSSCLAVWGHTKSFPLFPNHYFNISGLLPCCKNDFLCFCGGPLFVGPLFGRTCWTCLNPPLVPISILILTYGLTDYCVLLGVGDGHEQTHGAAGQLEDDGWDAQDLRRGHVDTGHVQRAYSGTSLNGISSTRFSRQSKLAVAKLCPAG